jgi:hypothetical protein
MSGDVQLMRPKEMYVLAKRQGLARQARIEENVADWVIDLGNVR